MANQLNLVGSYGTAPIAALIFSGLSLLSGGPLRSAVPALDPEGIFLAIYVNGDLQPNAWAAAAEAMVRGSINNSNRARPPSLNAH